jgi:hypothetical protein
VTRFNVPTATRGLAPSHGSADMHYAPGIHTARALGWFSIGLGLAELMAPREMTKLTGVKHPVLLQLYGLREIGTGIGILTCGRPAAWMWARVVGDALDLATLGSACIEGDESDRRAATVASSAVLGIMALDVATALSLATAEHLEG